MRIIIISYTFPPQSGIGGRRWAKFAKYFYQNGIDFRVLTTPVLESNSEWTEDIRGFSERITYLPASYPNVLRLNPKGIIQKIQYRIEAIRLKLTKKGNFYDHSMNWSKSVLPELEKLIDEGYTTIISTGGPFHYLSDIASLRKRHGDGVKLVADFRDPWTNNATSYGYTQLSTSRLNTEKEKELLVINSFDCIVCVADEMSKYFSSLMNSRELDRKFRLIPNGYDPNEIINFKPSVIEFPLVIVFVGTLYRKTMRSIKVFSNAVNSLQLSSIEFHFYGDITDEAKEVLENTKNVHTHSKVNLKEAHTIIAKSNLVLLFLTDDLTYSFSTKFCEYIAYQKPIWVISEDGKTPDFVVENGIGFHSLPSINAIKNFLREVETDFEVKLNEVDYSDFDLKPFNVLELSRHYIDLLKSL